MVISNRLTQRQAEILNFLREFIMEKGYAPSLREICRHFGIKGPNNAMKHLNALERKGFIKRSANISRAIEIVASPVQKTVSVPIVGRVKAGLPCPAIEDIEGYVALDSRFFRCRDTFLLKVEGDSMIDAGIEEGDYLLVKQQGDASNGDIVVAMLDNEATVKRFFRKRGGIILKPENPHMEAIEVNEKDGPFAVIGKVISIIKHVN